jgi:hypothetical protein
MLAPAAIACDAQTAHGAAIARIKILPIEFFATLCLLLLTEFMGILHCYEAPRRLDARITFM